MTEEAMKRMFELAEKHAVAYRDDFKRNVAEFHFTEGYQAGMQDPEAGKDSLAVVNLIHADEKIRELQVAYKGLSSGGES